MNFKQFRQPANGHARPAKVHGRIVGGLRPSAHVEDRQERVSLNRLEQLLARANQKER
jgi:hypothetical protein